MDLSTGTAAYDPSPLDGDADRVETGTSAADRLASERPPLLVERISFRTALAHQLAWADLAARTLEPNVFLEPAFAIPLLQHGGYATAPDILLVWEQNGPTSFGRLIGLSPLAKPGGLFRSTILRGFDHNQANRGVPLLDRERADEAFCAMLDWLHHHETRADALLLTGLPTKGAFYTMAARHGDRLRRLREHERAVLEHSENRTTALSFASAKRRKEMRRQRRRLSEVGERRYCSARTPAEIALATERFLVLEDRGWKGGRGTAMLASPLLSTFTRAMTRLMAQEGKCRIDSVEIGGRPVAMGIILTVGTRAHFWKTTFDETYAAWSPGVQFALELTEAQLDDQRISVTDSCAVPNHPMIDRIWRERMAVTDLMISLHPENGRRFVRACALEGIRGLLRENAKFLRRRLTGRT